MLTQEQIQDRIRRRNEAAVAEFKDNRDRAVAGLSETLSGRAVALRMDLFDAMEENQLLRLKVRDQEVHIKELTEQLKSLQESNPREPDVLAENGASS